VATCGEGACFSGSIMPHTPWRRGPSASQFLGLLSILAYTLCRRTTNFDVVTHMGRGLVFRGQQRPIPKGWVPELPNFGGSFLFMRTPFVSELPNLTWYHNTCVGGACMLGSATAPIPRQRSSWAPNFRGSAVFMPTPFNAERPNSVW